MTRTKRAAEWASVHTETQARRNFRHGDFCASHTPFFSQPVTRQNAGSHRNQSILSTGTYQAGPCGKTILPRCLSCSILDLAIIPCILTIWSMLLFPLSDASARASIWKREEGCGSRSGCRCSGNTLTECYFSIPSVLLSVSQGSLYQQKRMTRISYTAQPWKQSVV